MPNKQIGWQNWEASKCQLNGSLLEGRAEILKIFGWHFGKNDDLINSF